ncbi:MAG: head GIN domain-containing protein [Flavobacteriales bacterium]
MKKALILLMVSFLIGCNSENAPDCFQKAGTTIEQEFQVEPFSEIIVWEGVQLFIQQGEEQKVIVQTGENLLNDIEIKVIDGVLHLKNQNKCNYFRDYNLTKIVVTSPNINKIRNSSSFEIRSIGVLHYPELTLFSEDFQNPDYHIDGYFNLQLEVDILNVVSNGFSNFTLSGTANQANFGLYASSTRIDAGNLIVQNLNVFHRSINKMIVNPQQSITGNIVSVGDVICKNHPPIVEVEELFQGKLIFE